jgi:hypothetical protein
MPYISQTFRSIKDEDGPKVADSFYEYLFQEAHLDTTNAARSLHYAVLKLRKDKQCSFKRWVPFIHMGL